MTISKNILAGSGAVAEPYEINQSLIFSQTNDYLKRIPSSAGNRRTFTLSYWVKIGTIDGTSRVILTAGTSNSDVFHHNFESGGTPDDALRVVYYASGAFQINVTTNRVFRDPSAWYHIVLAIDTTQGTAANRVKMYVNGVQETSFATSVYPSQNLELNVNTATAHWIGQYHSADFPLRSYLAETHFIDGTALTPSSFGETNSATEQWIPKKYDGSYGTNGFYLPFSKNGNGGSAYLDGSGDGLNFATNSDFNFASNNFCIEAWVYRTRANGTRSFIFAQSDNNGANTSSSCSLSIEANNKFKVGVINAADTNQSVSVEASGTNNVNTWYHIAGVRNGNTLTLYQDGINVGSAAVNFAINYPSSEEWQIGKIDGLSWQTGFLGYVSNARIVNGSPVYTGNFTPSTTPLTNITNTKFLMNGGNSAIVGPALTGTDDTTFSVLQPFASSVTTFASDTSGNGNNYTSFNLNNADIVIDSPTNNFATWNPAVRTPYYVFSNGNLKLTVPNQWRNGIATMGVSTGKWYWEQIVSPSNLQYCNLGFVTDKGLFDNWLASGTYIGYKSWSWGYDGSNGKLWHQAAGGTQLTLAPTTQWKAAVALDLDNGKAWFSLNGVWMGTGANPSTGAGAAFSSLTTGINYYPATTIYNLNSTANFGQDGTFGGLATAQGNADTNGIGNFFYPVPTGFKALCTNNLPEPAITAKEHFNAVLYAGDNTTGRQITGVGFQPDLVWLKNRSVTNYHTLFDSVRGVTNYLFANDVSGEQSNSSSVTAFTSDGITVNHNASFGNNNANSSNYVTWNWKAGGTEPVKTYVVKVVSDSGNKYRFDDFAASSQTVDLQEGGTYTFDQSDSSNSGHPFRLSITNNGTHGGGSEYTTGVVTTGSPGSAGAKTVITVAASAPVLYYYCSVHSGMGGQIRTSPNSAHGSSYFDGDIRSTVSANQESGFSIVNYEPNGTASATVPHGLGVAPEMVFYKRYNSSSSWFCWTTVIDGSNDYLVLNGQDTLATVSQAGGTSFTSSFIRATNYANNSEAVAYCFASKPGFSKIGVYTGNGVADGPFVYTGFKPAWVMRKRVTGGNADWFINGGKINPANASVSGTGIANISLWANNPSVDEAAGEIAYGLELLSNGFKTTASAAYLNSHDSIYLYMAFAEVPFKYANAR